MSFSNRTDCVSNLFNLSTTPKYAHTPTATAPMMDIRFRIGIDIDVESLIFIIVVFIEYLQNPRSISYTLRAGCWSPAVFA